MRWQAVMVPVVDLVRMCGPIHSEFHVETVSSIALLVTKILLKNISRYRDGKRTETRGI